MHAFHAFSMTRSNIKVIVNKYKQTCISQSCILHWSSFIGKECSTIIAVTYACDGDYFLERNVVEPLLDVRRKRGKVRVDANIFLIEMTKIYF